MIIYEVNLSIHPSIVNDYLAWLKPHAEAMLQFTGFLSYELFRVDGEDDWQNYCVQYRLQSREALQSYFDTHAAVMRDDGLKRFGERFKASRRILQAI